LLGRCVSKSAAKDFASPHHAASKRPRWGLFAGLVVVKACWPRLRIRRTLAGITCKAVEIAGSQTFSKPRKEDRRHVKSPASKRLECRERYHARISLATASLPSGPRDRRMRTKSRLISGRGLFLPTVTDLDRLALGQQISGICALPASRCCVKSPPPQNRARPS